MTRVGLIAGEGILPILWAETARKKGVEIVTINVATTGCKDLFKNYSYAYYSMDVSQLDTIIQTFKKEKVDKAIMLGKVQKVQIYHDFKPDQRLYNLLHRLKVKNDDAILLAIVNEMAEEGIDFIDQTTFMDEFLAKEGILTSGPKLTPEILSDMEYGFKMAKEIGRLDIGQTVVIKGGAVIAVEAIEGTDQAILRGGQLARGVIVAKVSKPQQDFRFDVPTVGLNTMENLVKIGAKGLVIEAEKTFLIQKNEVLKLAEENGISVVAMR